MWISNECRWRADSFVQTHLGEIFYRIAPTSTRSQGATSFASYCNRYAIPDQWQQHTAAREHIHWHRFGCSSWLAGYLPFVFIQSCFPVLHPAGNIVEFLLGAGLAHLVEWHSGMLAPYGGSEKARAADRAAKEKRLGLHANAPTASALSKSISGMANGSERAFEGSVTRVWSGDQISVATKDGKERRIQLSSTRGPKCVCPALIWAGRLITCWTTGCRIQNRRTMHMRPASFSGKS